jgi:spermidine synthase
MKKKSPSLDDLAPATISEHEGVRYLHLGTVWVQGAMRIRKPDALELEYIQRMMVWTLLRPTAQVARGQAVQLGLGAAAITRFCHGVMKLRTTAVEINPTVIGVCRAFFRLPDDGARLKVLQMNAQDYVADPERADSVQVLCVDLYDHDAASPVLDSAEFYRGCAQLLADDGVMTVNLFGRDASFERSARRIQAAFPDGEVFALRPTREGNTIVAAIKRGRLPEREELAARAEQIETRYGLPARKWLRMMRALPTSEPTP